MRPPRPKHWNSSIMFSTWIGRRSSRHLRRCCSRRLRRPSRQASPRRSSRRQGCCPRTSRSCLFRRCPRSRYSSLWRIRSEIRLLNGSRRRTQIIWDFLHLFYLLSTRLSSLFTQHLSATLSLSYTHKKKIRPQSCRHQYSLQGSVSVERPLT